MYIYDRDDPLTESVTDTILVSDVDDTVIKTSVTHAYMINREYCHFFCIVAATAADFLHCFIISAGSYAVL